jgi:hypothetical protein
MRLCLCEATINKRNIKKYLESCLLVLVVSKTNINYPWKYFANILACVTGAVILHKCRNSVGKKI